MGCIAAGIAVCAAKFADAGTLPSQCGRHRRTVSPRAVLKEAVGAGQGRLQPITAAKFPVPTAFEVKTRVKQPEGFWSDAVTMMLKSAVDVKLPMRGAAVVVPS